MLTFLPHRTFSPPRIHTPVTVTTPPFDDPQFHHLTPALPYADSSLCVATPRLIFTTFVTFTTFGPHAYRSLRSGFPIRLRCLPRSHLFTFAFRFTFAIPRSFVPLLRLRLLPRSHAVARLPLPHAFWVYVTFADVYVPFTTSLHVRCGILHAFWLHTVTLHHCCYRLRTITILRCCCCVEPALLYTRYRVLHLTAVTYDDSHSTRCCHRCDFTLISDLHAHTFRTPLPFTFYIRYRLFIMVTPRYWMVPTTRRCLTYAPHTLPTALLRAPTDSHTTRPRYAHSFHRVPHSRLIYLHSVSHFISYVLPRFSLPLVICRCYGARCRSLQLLLLPHVYTTFTVYAFHTVVRFRYIRYPGRIHCPVDAVNFVTFVDFAF